MTRLLVAVIPVFLVMALGWLLRRRGVLDEPGRAALGSLVFRLALPALILNTLISADLGGHLHLSPALLVSAVFLAVFPLALAATHGRPAGERGVLVNALVRPNGALIGLPIGFLVAAALPDPAQAEALRLDVVLVLTGVVLVTNVLSVFGFLLPQGRRDAAGLVREVARNPIILACLAGLAAAVVVPPCRQAVAGTVWAGAWASLGAVLGDVLRMLGGAAIPLALIAAGAGLDLDLLRRRTRLLLTVSALRLVAVPALGFAAGWAMGLDRTGLAAAVLVLACPVAVSTVPVARALGGDEPLMAACVVASTLLAPPALVGWLAACL